MSYYNKKTKGMVEVKTNTVRLSWAHLIEPVKEENGEKKYKATLILDPEDKATLNDLSAALKIIKDEKFPGIPWGKKDEKGKVQSPIKTGEDNHQHEWLRGKKYINVSSFNKPAVYIVNDAGDFVEVEDESIIYSGCYGSAQLILKGYEVGGNKTITAYINSFFKTADGEHFAAKTVAKNVFAEDLAKVVQTRKVAQGDEAFTDHVDVNEDDLPF
jgi:hypothetical protein